MKQEKLDYKGKYVLVLTKEGAPRGCELYRNFDLIKQYVDVVWSGDVSEDEAIEKFKQLISEQGYKYRILKSISVWRVVRLYDKNGIMIRQES